MRSEDVDYIEVFPLDRPPTPHPTGTGEEAGRWPHWREVWPKNCHVDMQLTRSDFEATPRRDQLMMWLWLTEITPDRGAMRIMPRSHKVFMDYWEQTLLPEHRQELPRVHGLRPHDSAGGRVMGYQKGGSPEVEALPPPPPGLGFDAHSWLDIEPTAAVAHRGQLLIHCGAMLHFAWRSQPRAARPLSANPAPRIVKPA